MNLSTQRALYSALEKLLEADVDVDCLACDNFDSTTAFCAYYAQQVPVHFITGGKGCGKGVPSIPF